MAWCPADHLETHYENEESVAQKSRKSGRRRYYTSNKSQSLICNAVTGEPYTYRVGSRDQGRLYKITDCTGTCDEDGYVITNRKKLPNPNPNHLFYDSPEQCMSHMRISIELDAIKQWRVRASLHMPQC